MLKFFRKIRKRLLNRSSIGKYLLYALGEIILVVIGILIALQINTWNENRKLRDKEIAMLINFQESLKEDKAELELVIPSNDRVRNSIDLLVHHIENGLSYQDSLKYHFFNSTVKWIPNFQTSAFENLKSEGITLISNDNLRQAIVDYYDDGLSATNWQTETYRNVVMNAYETVLNTRFESFWDSNYDELIQKMLKPDNNPENDVNPSEIKGEMIPLDYESLKKDNEYLYFLKSLKNINSWHMDRVLKKDLRTVKHLIKEIESELAVLKP